LLALSNPATQEDIPILGAGLEINRFVCKCGRWWRSLFKYSPKLVKRLLKIKLPIDQYSSSLLEIHEPSTDSRLSLGYKDIALAVSRL
jgi:hypothetical protein